MATVKTQDVFTAAVEDIGRLASRHRHALVAYSCGKDSMAVLDLASRCFERVTALFLWFIPDLQFVEQQLEAARQRWHVDILRYPNPIFFDCLAEGHYCFNPVAFDDLPDVRTWDMAKLAMDDVGASICLTGMKDADGLWRKHILAKNLKKYPFVHSPLKSWTKYDVLAYLSSREIPLPESSDGHNSSAIDNSRQFILWLAKHHPDDFVRYLEYFPFAEAQVWREVWHEGNGSDYAEFLTRHRGGIGTTAPQKEAGQGGGIVEVPEVRGETDTPF